MNHLQHEIRHTHLHTLPLYFQTGTKFSVYRQRLKESSHGCTAASLVRCHGGEKRVQLLLCAKGSVQLRAMLASVMAVKLKFKSESYATSLGIHQAQKKGEPDSHTQNKCLICQSY